MKQYFEYIDEKSSKFWEIEVLGNKTVVRYGKIGTDGQIQEKEFDSTDKAKAEAEKLVKEKTKKGYIQTGEDSRTAKDIKLTKEPKPQKNIIKFKDINFKLTVIQELMYQQKILKPEFDVYEFVENYKKRKINIDKEGYEIIPEVLNYFKNLEITSEIAEKVESISMDGGDDIYRQIIPFWDGEDETFDITLADDVAHFPNLKKIALLNQDMIDEFESKGIKAWWFGDKEDTEEIISEKNTNKQDDRSFLLETIKISKPDYDENLQNKFCKALITVDDTITAEEYENAFTYLFDNYLHKPFYKELSSYKVPAWKAESLKKALSKKDQPDTETLLLLKAAENNQIKAVAKLLYNSIYTISYILDKVMDKLVEKQFNTDLIPTIQKTLQAFTIEREFYDKILYFMLCGFLAKDGSEQSVNIILQCSKNFFTDYLDTYASILKRYGNGKYAELLLINLQKAIEERNINSESQQLANKLGLPFNGTDWSVIISICPGKATSFDSSDTPKPQIFLRLRPSDRQDWEIQLYDKTGQFDCKRGRTLQNDCKCEEIKNLIDFPQWLLAIEKHFNIKLSYEKAYFDCSKNKKAVEILRNWISGKI